MTVLTCLPGEEAVSTAEAKHRSKEEQQEEGGSVGLPDLQWMLLGTRERRLKAASRREKRAGTANLSLVSRYHGQPASSPCPAASKVPQGV